MSRDLRERLKLAERDARIARVAADGLGSMLLDVQRECIAAQRSRADAAQEHARDMTRAVGQAERAAEGERRALVKVAELAAAEQRARSRASQVEGLLVHLVRDHIIIDSACERCTAAARLVAVLVRVKPCP